MMAQVGDNLNLIAMHNFLHSYCARECAIEKRYDAVNGTWDVVIIIGTSSNFTVQY